MAEKGGNDPMRIDTKLVRELAKLLDTNNLTEIEVEDGERKIKVARSFDGGGGALSPAQIAAFSMGPAMAQSMNASPAADSKPASALSETAAIEGTLVKSPMVGTAYLSPEPGAKQFAGVGDSVKAGDTLLIIEAMKVMNPITAPSAGTIKQLMISDAQPVEFDQPLVVIG